MGSCSFKYELPLPDMATVVTILWPFTQMFSKHSSPDLRNIPWHFPADSYLKHSCTKIRHSSILYLSQGTLLHQQKIETCIYQQQTRWFIAQVCYDQQLKLHSCLKTVWQTLHGCILRYDLWPPHSPDLTPCDFYSWRILSDKNVENQSSHSARTKQQHWMWHFNNLWRRILDSNHHLLQLYWVHSVGKAAFSASAATLVSIY